MNKRIVLVGALVVAAAVTVVNVRHRSRVLFAQLQELQTERDALNIEWGKLLLEEGTWSQHARVEAVARNKLEMALPRPDQIVVVHVRPEQP